MSDTAGATTYELGGAPASWFARRCCAYLAVVTLLGLPACVTEEVKSQPDRWELVGDPIPVTLGSNGSLAGLQDAPDPIAADNPDDLLGLLTVPASPADLDPDFLADQPPSPFHRLGPNVIRGVDGSWTKMFTLHAGRGEQVIEVLRAYVPDFPAEPGVPNDPLLPPTQSIRYVLHAGFIRDELQESFGLREPLTDPSIADVLHVTAPPDTLLFITELLHKLLADLPQVELQVRVVEVNLDDLVDWDAKVVARSLSDPDLPYDAVTNPTSGNFGAGVPILDPTEPSGIGTGFNSFASAVTLNGFLLSLQGVHNNLRVDGVISLLQTIGAGELISSPTVTVLNGHRAALTTGDKVPVFTASGNANQPNVSTSFEPTGVTIDMVPFILSENLVRLDVSIDVSAQTGSVPFVISGVEVESPIISQRAAGTTVHVYSGQVLVVGGLRQSTQIETITKVPLFGDIPIIGWLFKSRSTRKKNTEILMMVTPTIKIPSETLRNPLGL
jgi:general secretion pathway protein D